MRILSSRLSIILMLCLGLFLASCATKPLKAPCDEVGTFCGKKTKINPW